MLYYVWNKNEKSTKMLCPRMSFHILRNTVIHRNRKYSLPEIQTSKTRNNI